MAARATRRRRSRLATGVVVGVVGLAGAIAGCSNDQALITGPTPAGVTTGVTTGDGAPASSSTSSPVADGGAGNAGPAEVVVGLELKVRQAAGGCWESFAPGAPSGATRQDLWFATAGSCQGAGWSVALQVFATNSELNAATRVPTTAATVLRQGTVAVVVAPSASSAVRTLLSSQPGVTTVSPAGG